VQDPPADRSEQPLGHKERRADEGEDEREQDDEDRDTDEGRDLGDLALDGRRLGLGEIDVGNDEPTSGVTGEAELVAQSGRLRPGLRRAVVVQGRAPARVGRTAGEDRWPAAMIAAPG